MRQLAKIVENYFDLEEGSIQNTHDRNPYVKEAKMIFIAICRYRYHIKNKQIANALGMTNVRISNLLQKHKQIASKDPDYYDRYHMVLKCGIPDDLKVEPLTKQDNYSHLKDQLTDMLYSLELMKKKINELLEDMK